MLTYKRAKQVRAFQDVVEQIQNSIVQGQIAAGDKLPAERELKDMFKISRGTLREALRALEQKGLLTIKTGSKGGAIVNRVTTRQFRESLDMMIRHGVFSLEELAQFREGVESTVAALAAEKARKKDIKRLKDLVADLKIATEMGLAQWNEFIRIDIAIHQALAEIAGNSLYEAVLKTIHGNISNYYEKWLPKTDKVMRDNLKDLVSIVQAVEDEKGEDARRVAQVHVRRNQIFMEEKRQT